VERGLAAGAWVLAALTTLGAGGCTGSHTIPAGTPASAAPVQVRAVAPAGVPRCTIASASAPALGRSRISMVGVGGRPFGIAVSPDGRWVFVASPTGGVEVLRTGTHLTPARTIHAGLPLGETLAGGGRYLLAASGTGAVVISVARAERGGAGAVLGTLASPSGAGAIEVAVSRDGRFAFVSLEASARVAVFDLRRALTRGFGPADYVGAIPLGLAPVGLAVSPDDRWLYATSELSPTARFPRVSRSTARPAATDGRTRIAAVPGPDVPGTLTVVSVQRAETDPAGSVVATVEAGCQPVRVITSADGRTVWVTARASDALLGFSAALLRSDPAHALIARVWVGEAPVGLALVDHGGRIVVADSNRFLAPGVTSNLAVVNVGAALAGKPALAGLLPAGQFPREMAPEPGGRTLLVTNFNSGQVELVNVAGLP
jgi:DNA-binding beta-propeller fold protein YncE